MPVSKAIHEQLVYLTGSKCYSYLCSALQKILIIQTAFTGDVVLATPLLEKLHDTYPEAAIDFLLRKGNEGLLTGHPFLRHTLIFDKKSGKLRNLFALSRRIRKERYDLVINLHRFGSSGFLVWRSGAKEKVGFDKNPFSFCYHRKIRHEIGTGKHEIRRNMELIAHLAGPETLRPKLYPGADDEKKVSFHKSHGPYVCMAPTSVWFTKQWPAEKWVELIRMIPAKYRVYLIGAPADVEACDKIIKTAGRKDSFNLCGQLTLLQSAALMKDAAMNYVNDSAPAHMASAVNAPVTEIFCSTIPAYGFGAVSEHTRIIETKEKLACRPCGLHGHKECPENHFKCALGIPADDVMGNI
ncbi:MAG: heptosyltransferase II [Bacteroidetes bacterium]|nr:MAG: heptosyltransferase II [Bacteroidota bacterium]